MITASSVAYDRALRDHKSIRLVLTTRSYGFGWRIGVICVVYVYVYILYYNIFGERKRENEIETERKRIYEKKKN